MVRSEDLTALLGDGRFTRIESTFRKHFGFGLEVADHDGVRLEGLCSEDGVPEFCRIACGGAEGESRCRADRMRSIRAAAATGRSDVTLCHAGIVVGCVPLMDGERPLGGVLFGRCLAEPVTETLKDEIVRRGAKRGVDEEMLAAAVGTLRRIGDGEMQEAAEFLFDLVHEVTGLDTEIIRWRRERARQRRQIERFIEEHREQGVIPEYPLESERELLAKVKIADRAGSDDILERVLGTVLLRAPDCLKVRAVELLSVLSRSAIEGGAGVEVIFDRNAGYVEKVLGGGEQWDICAWLSTALDDYVEMVCLSQDARKVSQVRPAVNYIKTNYSKAVTLADVAKASHLSVSRLAHLFKEQMGVTIIEYLTQVRIERAKELLLRTEQNCTEICFNVGYNNQSYFTRTFKDQVGVTPSRFRARNKRRK